MYWIYGPCGWARYRRGSCCWKFDYSRWATHFFKRSIQHTWRASTSRGIILNLLAHEIFLSSNESKYIIGMIVSIDNGQNAYRLQSNPVQCVLSCSLIDEGLAENLHYYCSDKCQKGQFDFSRNFNSVEPQTCISVSTGSICFGTADVMR